MYYAQDMPKCKEYFDDMESFEMNKDWLAVRPFASSPHLLPLC